MQKTMKQTMTKEELNKVTEKWLAEQDPQTFDNPITRIAVQDEGKFDAEADARQWANDLPDKNQKRTSN